MVHISVFTARDLGESCDIDIQCVANNASCVNQFCVCHPAFYKFDEATCAESMFFFFYISI